MWLFRRHVKLNARKGLRRFNLVCALLLAQQWITAPVAALAVESNKQTLHLYLETQSVVFWRRVGHHWGLQQRHTALDEDQDESSQHFHKINLFRRATATPEVTGRTTAEHPPQLDEFVTVHIFSLLGRINIDQNFLMNDFPFCGPFLRHIFGTARKSE